MHPFTFPKPMTLVPASLASEPGHSLRKTLHVLAALAGVLAFSLPTPTLADDLSDVTRMLRSGQSAEALVRIESFLDKHPRDMQMRFIKGVVLTEQGKTAEAIVVFTKLTEDHPDLPEPYNNLAVLFAANGQYDKARAALDMAIRTNPSYATAYENLGDVHAKLASQAYDKALQLDSGNVNAKSKLTLLRTLTVNAASKETAAKAQPAVATANAAPKPAPALVPAPIVVARAEPPKDTAVKPKAELKPEPKPESKPESKAEAKSVLKPDGKPELKPVARPEPKVEAKAVVVAMATAKPGVASPDNEEVMAAVNDWAAAWSSQDVKRYLSHYGSDFETPKGEARKVWADERTSRIAGKGRINVKVDKPQVAVNGDTATVKFRQVYSSDRLQADSRKLLVLTRQGGKWQIKQERTGN